MAKSSKPVADKQDLAPAPAAGNGKAPRCPVSRERFKAKAPVTQAVTIGGFPLAAVRKEFSTGSFGYYAQGKVTLEIDGEAVDFQVGLNVTAVGSKDLPQ